MSADMTPREAARALTQLSEELGLYDGEDEMCLSHPDRPVADGASCCEECLEAASLYDGTGLEP